MRLDFSIRTPTASRYIARAAKSQAVVEQMILRVGADNQEIAKSSEKIKELETQLAKLRKAEKIQCE